MAQTSEGKDAPSLLTFDADAIRNILSRFAPADLALFCSAAAELLADGECTWSRERIKQSLAGESHANLAMLVQVVSSIIPAA